MHRKDPARSLDAGGIEILTEADRTANAIRKAATGNKAPTPLLDGDEALILEMAEGLSRGMAVNTIAGRQIQCGWQAIARLMGCLLYTSDAADE